MRTVIINTKLLRTENVKKKEKADVKSAIVKNGDVINYFDVILALEGDTPKYFL